MMWFVYTLLCADQSLYTGYTDDVAKRFQLHQSGKGAKYTRARKPIKIVYSQSFDTKSEAMKRENEIKGWSRSKKISQLKIKL